MERWASKKKPELRLPSQVDSGIAERLVAQARAEGVDLVRPGWTVERAYQTDPGGCLEVEMEEHLGNAKHAPEGRDGGNSRNGTRSKKVLTEVGPVDYRRAP